MYLSLFWLQILNLAKTPGICPENFGGKHTTSHTECVVGLEVMNFAPNLHGLFCLLDINTAQSHALQRAVSSQHFDCRA